MNRLSERLPNGLGAVVKPGYGLPEALEKLAAYEDTGLTPAEVEAQKKYRVDGIPAKRFCEILAAEAEGRLIVLPVRAGDEVYSIRGNYDQKQYVRKLTIMGVTSPEYRTVTEKGYRGIDFYPHEIGKNVFFTEEEAEKAIKDKTRI